MHEVRSKLAGEERELVVKRRAKAKRGDSGPSLASLAITRTEARTSNQRREERHLKVCETAVLKFRNRKHEVRVTNVSNHGTMIEADIAPRIGERVQIAFEGCIRTDCIVRWVRGPRIGLEFHTETVVVASAKVRDAIVSGRRTGESETPELREVTERPPRQTLLWTAVMHWADGSQQVRVRNISAEGAMLEAQEDLPEHLEVVLDLGGGGAAGGHVRWSRAGQIGVAFDERYDLRRLARQGLPAGTPATDMLKPSYLEDELDPDSPWAGRWERLGPQDLAG
jgi:hypothetical protein